MDTTEESFADATTAGSSTEHQYSTQYKVSTVALFAACTVIIAGLNALVIISFLFKGIPRTQSNFYMFQLAIADGLLGLSMPINMLSSISYALSKNTPYCAFETLWTVSCVMASGFGILCLTRDRFQALRYPLVYDSDMTTKRYIASTLLVWLIPVSVFFVLPQIWFQGLEDTPLKTCYTLYILKREFVAYIFLPICFMLNGSVSTVYVLILKMAVKQSRAVGAGALDQAEVKRKSQRRILKTATLVLVPFFICWMSWCFTAAAIVYDDHEYNIPGAKFVFLQYSAYLVILTSAVNPIIYAARMPEYRRAFKACLGCSAQLVSTVLKTRKVQTIGEEDVEDKNECEQGNAEHAKRTCFLADQEKKI
ncbi:hypothetical protein CAPTEDRAFT_195578 [Capitella teleta]|uniref:G-protein coupled receptors family 1 profile domain-containing protein n=1 Tax=Capitella teleta TaxID=283909 RepID=R7UIS6_CAPTE|nr:hypothetical protein CAPTEDRAFT_195578 [Capitella teleta]|eukprot:ELU03187.1 hypothetical protein CAPTEDRAFT_195578 [Capitella teleta]